MGFFDFFRKKEERAVETPKSENPPKSSPAATQDSSSIIRKRASAIGIPPNTVQDALARLSQNDLRLLANSPDNFFMIYLWSPQGTQAKANAARAIGLSL